MTLPTAIAPLPKLRFTDSSGNALSGGKLFTYAAGTTTKQTTYTDSTGATQNANPIILDSRGECSCWFNPSQPYKLTLAPSTDTDPPTSPIWTVDNLGASASSKQVPVQVTNIAALKALAPGSTGDGARVDTLGYYGRNDGGHGSYLWNASDNRSDNGGSVIQGTDSSGRWNLLYDGTINALQWGVYGDGTATHTQLQALDTYIATLTSPVKILFPGARTYKIAATVGLHLPEGSVVEADGAKFVCTHDGAGFDLNPAATAAAPITVTTDTYTKHDITWRGGSFTNTSAAKTASTAFQAYMMRWFTLEGIRAGDLSGNGFYAFCKFGGKDTYRFIDCYTFSCVRHYWVPAAGVIYTGSLTGNDLIDVQWIGCSMTAGSVGQAGIYMENRVRNLGMSGGSVNGAFSVAHVLLSDNGTLFSDSYRFSGVHFEQMGDGLPALWFKYLGAPTGGHYSIDIGEGCYFGSGTANWQGIKLEKCTGARVGTATLSDGSGHPSFGVSVDGACRDVRVASRATFLGFFGEVMITGCGNNGSGLIRVTATGHGLQTGARVWIRGVGGNAEANGMWLITKVDNNTLDLQSSTFTTVTSGGTLRILNGIVLDATGTRQYVTCEPETVSLVTPSVLTSYNPSPESTGSGVINMSQQFPEFCSLSVPPTLLWPKGYDLHMRVRDSASAAAAAGTCYASLKRTSGSALTASVQQYCAGLPNNAPNANSGYVAADTDGSIYKSANASGTGTLSLYIGITGVRQ